MEKSCFSRIFIKEGPGAGENNTANTLAVVARGNLIELYTNGIKIGEVDTTEPPKPIPSLPKPYRRLIKAAIAAYEEQVKEYEDIIKQSQMNYQKSLKSMRSSRQYLQKDSWRCLLPVNHAALAAHLITPSSG